MFPWEVKSFIILTFLCSLWLNICATFAFRVVFFIFSLILRKTWLLSPQWHYFYRFFHSSLVHVKDLVQTILLSAFTPLSHLTGINRELLMDLATLHFSGFTNAHKWHIFVLENKGTSWFHISSCRILILSFKDRSAIFTFSSFLHYS